MSNRHQRATWAEHLKDEAVAHEKQQQSAGVSHGPLQGPLPFSADDLNGARREGAQLERERCARIAEDWIRDLATRFPAFDREEIAAASAVLQELQRSIRGDEA